MLRDEIQEAAYPAEPKDECRAEHYVAYCGQRASYFLLKIFTGLLVFIILMPAAKSGRFIFSDHLIGPFVLVTR